MGKRLIPVMTAVAFIAWVLALTPFAHRIVPPDNLPAITGVLTALLGLPVGLQALSRK